MAKCFYIDERVAGIDLYWHTKARICLRYVKTTL